MVSKNQKKLIKSLYQKKYRKQHGLFVAEGKKVIGELLQAKIQLHALYTTDVVFDQVSSHLSHQVNAQELEQISFLTTSQKALAIFCIPQEKPIQLTGLTLVLDDVRDPGNLGTIIRLCDWFGIKELICSKATVDCYNPKVIQATMGSIARVKISYVNLTEFLQKHKNTIATYGTFMNGNNIYNEQLPQNSGLIIMGNEANGISEEIEKMVSNRITIPQFGSQKETESLNVATATAIILSEFRRGFIEK